MNLPAQISVQSAMEIMLEENQANVIKVDEVIAKIKNENGQSTELLKSIASDKRKVVSLFVNSDSWKTSRESLIDFITLNLNNGFNNQVLSLNDDEWSQLYNYLINMI
jgi:hypothetical protein